MNADQSEAVRFQVESWDPEFGSPLETTSADLPVPEVDLDVESPASRWSALTPPAAAPMPVLFVDGVRRIDARVWIDDVEEPRLGLCASYAAGAVRCNRQAQVVAAEVERSLYSTRPRASISTRHGDYQPRAVSGEDPGSFVNELRASLRGLELRVAEAIPAGELVVVDGPLTRHDQVTGAVGYIKTHRVDYLPASLRQLVGQLKPGQRTPLFVTQTSWSRYSWYFRLPGGSGHAWAGVARCELPSQATVEAAIAQANRVTALLPRFASASHKEPRAPQNLYPIAGLERQLRRRLGDPRLIYNGVCLASVRGR